MPFILGMKRLRRRATRNICSQSMIAQNWMACTSAFCALVARLAVQVTGGTVINTWGQQFWCRHTGGSLTHVTNQPKLDWTSWEIHSVSIDAIPSWIALAHVQRDWIQARLLLKSRNYLVDSQRRENQAWKRQNCIINKLFRIPLTYIVNELQFNSFLYRYNFYKEL